MYDGVLFSTGFLRNTNLSRVTADTMTDVTLEVQTAVQLSSDSPLAAHQQEDMSGMESLHNIGQEGDILWTYMDVSF